MDDNKRTKETTYTAGNKPVTRDVIKDYVDPATSAINKGAGEAAKGMKDTELDAGAPKREDFPAGIVGQSQFNKAQIEYRQKKRAKSPMKAAAQNLMKANE